MKNTPTCCTPYGLPPLHPELQAAHDEMDASGDYFAYAVCRTHDGVAWEVNYRMGNIYSALDDRHRDRDVATASGAAWLRQQLDREPNADELAHRQLWEQWVIDCAARPR